MTSARRTLLIVTLGFVAGILLLWLERHLASTRHIEIVEATYGVPGRTCTAGPDVKRRATEACGGLWPRCLVSVSSGWCGDPAPGVQKTLTVDYKCGTKQKRAAAAEYTPLILTCP